MPVQSQGPDFADKAFQAMLHRKSASCVLVEDSLLISHESKYGGDTPLLQTSEGFLPMKLIVQLLKTHCFYFHLAWNANAISVLRQLSVDEHKRRKGTMCLLVTSGKHSAMANRQGCCNRLWYKEIAPSKLHILGQHGTVNTHLSSLRSPFTDPSFSPEEIII